MLADDDLGSATHRSAGSAIDSGGIAIDRMPGLTSFLEKVSTAFGSQLAPLLGLTPKCKLERVEVTSLVRATVPNPSALAGMLACRDTDTRLAMIFEPNVVDAVMAAIFESGQKAMPVFSSDLSPRVMTAMEKRIVTEFAHLFGRAVETTLGEHSTDVFEFDGLRQLDEDFITIKRDIPAVEAWIAVDLPSGKTTCRLILPNPFIQNFRDVFTQDDANRAPAPDNRWSRKMSAGVSKAPVTVAAVIEEFDMTLGDITAFKVGHVLDLSGSGLGRVRLECAGRGIFWGKVGRSGSLYRVEIEEPIDNEDELVSLPSLG